MKNTEIRRGGWIYLLLTAAAASMTGVWLNGTAALAVLLGCLLTGGVFWVLTYRRYQRLARLSREIDRILHGQESALLEDGCEGELSILQSEIFKMTVRLREQAEALQRDKRYLADSLADISHQIRTPLTSAHLIVSFLAEPGLTEERRLALASELTGLLSRIHWLVDALLKMSRLDAGMAEFQNEPVCVSQLIQTAADPLAVPMELRDQSLVLSLQGEERFQGDLDWSAEALSNILKNCMEHTPAGGRIELSAQENALFTEIVVRDTGPGISAADLPHLFERFYKGRPSGEQGFGIGLSLAKMIFTQQSGVIRADNHPDGGARFTIRLYKGAV